MALLEVKDLYKSFDSLQVLRGISFSLEQGETLSVIGPSGGGKTTLLRCMNFLGLPDSGSISVNGETLFDSGSGKTLSDADIRRNRLHFGLVFQNFNLFPQYTALENVMLAPRLQAKERPDFRANRKAIIRRAPREERGAACLRRPQRTSWITIRTSSPAASSSASPLRARLRSSPKCCSSTSRRPR